MNTNSEKIDLQRRHLIGAAAVTAAAAQLGILDSASAQSAKAAVPYIKPGTHTSFGPLKHINAGALDVAYAEAGPADGLPVILLHGWPYDIHSFVDVTPMLASAGYRVLFGVGLSRARRLAVSRMFRRASRRSGRPRPASSSWPVPTPLVRPTLLLQRRRGDSTSSARRHS
jgi:hypothetical protein